MSPTQQKTLFENTASAIADAPKEVKLRHIGNCLKADKGYGKGITKAMGIKLSEVTKKRANLVGGSFRIDSTPGRGTTASVELLIK